MENQSEWHINREKFLKPGPFGKMLFKLLIFMQFVSSLRDLSYNFEKKNLKLLSRTAISCRVYCYGFVLRQFKMHVITNCR